jgi:hypothetical protein
MVLVRSWLGVTPFGREARRVMVEASVRASRVREVLADIINTAIEELVRQRFELPAFSALLHSLTGRPPSQTESAKPTWFPRRATPG